MTLCFSSVILFLFFLYMALYIRQLESRLRELEKRSDNQESAPKEPEGKEVR